MLLCLVVIPGLVMRRRRVVVFSGFVMAVSRVHIIALKQDVLQGMGSPLIAIQTAPGGAITMPYVLTQKPKIGGLTNQKSKVISFNC